MKWKTATCLWLEFAVFNQVGSSHRGLWGALDDLKSLQRGVHQGWADNRVLSEVAKRRKKLTEEDYGKDLTRRFRLVREDHFKYR